MKVSEEITALLDSESWVEARKLIKKELIKDTHNHWLLIRLSLTFYEEKKYQKALEVGEKALDLAPKCPLVRWNVAGALQMVGRGEEAIRIWKALLRRSVNSLAFGKCGEGLEWARSLQNDCRYRIANEYRQQGKIRLAERYFLQYLDYRKRRVRSVYSICEARKRLAEVQNKVTMKRFYA